MMDNNLLYIINNKVIWDFGQLIPCYNKENFIADMDNIFPRPLTKDYVTFCFVKFNVTSIIYEKATANEVFEGYNLVIKDLKNQLIEYLIETIFARFLDEFITYFNKEPKKAIMIEPIVTLLLRFFYWYYKCSKVWSTNESQESSSKRKEIRSKITQKFLRVFEQYHQSITYDKEFSNDEELIKWIKLQQNNISLSKSKNDPIYKKYINVLVKTLKNINSELMLASLCNNYYDVSFDLFTSVDHDFDFLINGIGVQVKTISETPTEKEKNILLEKIETDGLIDQVKLEREFFNFLLDNDQIDHLEKSIEKQKARIIFFNLSETLIGMALMRLMMENNFGNLFHQSLIDSIKLATDNNSNYLPLIIFVSHSENTYLFNCFYLKIPIMRKDGFISLDRARIQGFTNK